MTTHVVGGGVAQLFRSRAEFAEEVVYEASELIGSGSLDKMVRIAMSDPDDEMWRYSIRSGVKMYRGNEIQALSGA